MVGLVGGAGSEPKKGEKNHPIVESKEHNPPPKKRGRGLILKIPQIPLD